MDSFLTGLYGVVIDAGQHFLGVIVGLIILFVGYALYVYVVHLNRTSVKLQQQANDIAENTIIDDEKEKLIIQSLEEVETFFEAGTDESYRYLSLTWHRFRANVVNIHGAFNELTNDAKRQAVFGKIRRVSDMATIFIRDKPINTYYGDMIGSPSRFSVSSLGMALRSVAPEDGIDALYALSTWDRQHHIERPMPLVFDGSYDINLTAFGYFTEVLPDGGMNVFLGYSDSGIALFVQEYLDLKKKYDDYCKNVVAEKQKKSEAWQQIIIQDK